MSMNVERIEKGSGVFVTADKSAINCRVKFSEFAEVLTFTATATDPEAHGRKVWQLLQDGTAGAIAAYVPPEPAASEPFALYKTDVTGRMTDEELDAFDAALSAASTRERRLWADCTRLVSDDFYFAALHARLTEAFTQTRADAILAAP